MAVLFFVAYFAFEIGEDPDLILGYGASNVTLGLTLGLALLFIGIGATQWARKLMSDEEIAEDRHPTHSSDEDRDVAVSSFEQGVADSGIARRPLIRNTLIGALGALGLPAIVGLRDLGPLPGNALATTVWERGMRVVNDVSGDADRAVPDGDRPARQRRAGRVLRGRTRRAHALYEGAELQAAKSKAAVILVRMRPEDITPGADARTGASTASCATPRSARTSAAPSRCGSSRRTTCSARATSRPSTSADSGKVIFGPAARALPQLPLMLDDEGFLVAQSDFTEPVGPSYWERG